MILYNKFEGHTTPAGDFVIVTACLRAEADYVWRVGEDPIYLLRWSAGTKEKEIDGGQKLLDVDKEWQAIEAAVAKWQELAADIDRLRTNR